MSPRILPVSLLVFVCVGHGAGWARPTGGTAVTGAPLQQQSVEFLFQRELETAGRGDTVRPEVVIPCRLEAVKDIDRDPPAAVCQAVRVGSNPTFREAL